MGKKSRSLKGANNQLLFTINNLQDKDQITTEFTHHFNCLPNTPRITTENVPHKNATANNTIIDTAKKFILSSFDIMSEISTLNIGKSSDPFDILAEHIVAIRNPFFSQWLTDLYNELFDTCEVPSDLSCSLIVPLVKSYKKSLKSANNYRGISLIPTMTKLLEST